MEPTAIQFSDESTETRIFPSEATAKDLFVSFGISDTSLVMISDIHEPAANFHAGRHRGEFIFESEKGWVPGIFEIEKKAVLDCPYSDFHITPSPPWIAVFWDQAVKTKDARSALNIIARKRSELHLTFAKKLPDSHQIQLMAQQAISRLAFLDALDECRSPPSLKLKGDS